LLEKIKYLHIMTHPGIIINSGIIDMINVNNEGFNSQDHLFLVGYDDIYKKYQKYSNVKYIPKLMTKNFKRFLQYSKNADYIFLHQNWFYDYFRFIFTPIKIKRKYIWCVWGHDLYTNFGKVKGVKEKIKLVLRRIGDAMINHEIKFYHGIGIGFKYDALEIKKRFKDKVKILMCPYLSGVTTKQLDSFVAETRLLGHDDQKPVRIMVAHSAHEYLHHKEMLDKLARYKEKNILISLVLAYGNQAYAAEIERYAKQIFGEKVEILRKPMELNDYLRYLAIVDIAIFDQIFQSGSGNIHDLLYMEKKIYLNPDGVFRLYFQLEGIYLDTTDYLGLEPFAEFIKENPTKGRGKQYAAFVSDNKNLVDMWKWTLKSLK
jgi:dTDP-N-acetylfucosamine:lipid II N-acetylfucosaminyltransferase